MTGFNAGALIQAIKKNPLFKTTSIIGLSKLIDSTHNFDFVEDVTLVPSKHLRSTLLRSAITQAVNKRQNKPLFDQLKSKNDEPNISSQANENIDVLVAEDNDVNQTYARFVLEEIGLSYRVVPNGKEAVKAWQALSPKIILMDISMPVQNGYQATAHIRRLETEQNLARTPIIAVTAHTLKDDEQKCLDSGMDGLSSQTNGGLAITIMSGKMEYCPFDASSNQKHK